MLLGISGFISFLAIGSGYLGVVGHPRTCLGIPGY